MDAPRKGNIVDYVLPGDRDLDGQEREALVVAVFSGNVCNLRFFGHPEEKVCKVGLEAWSVSYDEGKAPGTWHWPQRA